MQTGPDLNQNKKGERGPTRFVRKQDEMELGRQRQNIGHLAGPDFKTRGAEGQARHLAPQAP